MKENSHHMNFVILDDEIIWEGIRNDLFEEIQRLVTINIQELKDLNEIGYNEKIIITIIDKYEKKIDLLELIILKTNKPESHENTIYNYL